MPTAGLKEKLESTWPMPRTNAVIDLPKFSPDGTNVTLGIDAETSATSSSPRASICSLVTVEMAIGVCCADSVVNRAVTTTSFGWPESAALVAGADCVSPALAAGVDCCATPAPEYAAAARTTPRSAVFVHLIVIFTVSPDKALARAQYCADRTPIEPLRTETAAHFFTAPSILVGCLLAGLLPICRA